MEDLLSRVTDTPINSQEALGFVRDAACGAVSTFEGTIRSENKGQQVVELFYECYDGLFHKVNAALFSEIKQRWDVRKMAVIQRVGTLQVGEAGIVIAVSSPHRAAALNAVHYSIEEFKKRSPVWKKETTIAGDEWINWPREHQSA